MWPSWVAFQLERRTLPAQRLQITCARSPMDCTVCDRTDILTQSQYVFKSPETHLLKYCLLIHVNFGINFIVDNIAFLIQEILEY
jgi:hypothetical protein